MACLLPIGPSTLRATLLDACGKPVTGVGNAYVADCFTSISMSAVTDDQDDIIYKNAAGKLCAVKRGCSTLLGYDVEMHISGVQPELVALLTGDPEVLDAGGATVGYDSCAYNCNHSVAIEVWAELIGDTCSTPGAVPQYLYTVIPWLQNVTVGDLEYGTDALDFQLTGKTRAGGQWGVGPWNVVPATPGPSGPMLTPLGSSCHRRVQSTTIAPPAAACTAIAVP
jgi:hypothetical protein